MKKKIVLYSVLSVFLVAIVVLAFSYNNIVKGFNETSPKINPSEYSLIDVKKNVHTNSYPAVKYNDLVINSDNFLQFSNQVLTNTSHKQADEIGPLIGGPNVDFVIALGDKYGNRVFVTVYCIDYNSSDYLISIKYQKQDGANSQEYIYSNISDFCSLLNDSTLKPL